MFPLGKTFPTTATVLTKVLRTCSNSPACLRDVDFCGSLSAAKCWSLRRSVPMELRVRCGAPDVSGTPGWLGCLQPGHDQLAFRQKNNVLLSTESVIQFWWIQTWHYSHWMPTVVTQKEQRGICYNFDGVPALLDQVGIISKGYFYIYIYNAEDLVVHETQ